MKDLSKLTFEAACKIEKLDPKKVVPDFSYFPAKERKAMIAHAKIVIMVKAANRIANDGKEWKPDYKDDNYKYEPRYYFKGGSSGFRFYVCAYWVSLSGVGSRLCFKDNETMIAMADKNKNYLKLWNEYAL